MMDEHSCDDALAELYRYLDRELDDEARRRVESHLRQCSPCLEAFDFESELKRVIALRCRDSAPAELRDRVMEALRRCEGANEPFVDPFAAGGFSASGDAPLH